MTLRELLGLHPDRVSEMTDKNRQDFAIRLLEAWPRGEILTQPDPQTSAEGGPETALFVLQEHTLSLARTSEGPPSPLDFIAPHDEVRETLGEDALLVAQLKLDGLSATLTPLSISPEHLGITLDGLFVLTPLQEEEEFFQGTLLLDDSWGRAELPGLDGRSEHESVQALEPLFRRYLSEQNLQQLSVQVLLAPQAPLAIWFAPSHRALLVNPNLLYLFSHGQEGDKEQLPTTRRIEASLDLDFLNLCVNYQKRRCEECFAPSGDASEDRCAPLFPQDELFASEECTQLNENSGEGFELYCYNRYINDNFACFNAKDFFQGCGTGERPYTSIHDLSSLAPMRQEEACQRFLLECEDLRTQPPQEPLPQEEESAPPPVSPSHSSDDTSEAICTACGEIACQALLEGICNEGCADACNSCEGDGLTASSHHPRPVEPSFPWVFGFTILGLGGIAWRSRPDDPDDDERS